MPKNATIRLQRDDFDAAAETAKLARGRTDIGAVVTFTGICRDNEAGHGVAAMTLEHYPGMAEEEIARQAHKTGETLAQTRRSGKRRQAKPPVKSKGTGRSRKR